MTMIMRIVEMMTMVAMMTRRATVITLMAAMIMTMILETRTKMMKIMGVTTMTGICH